MDKKNVPINKGQLFLEPEDRMNAFDMKRSVGWGEGYFKYRRNWEIFPKEQVVSEYPLLVDMELSTICNLRCPMCYTTTEEYKKKIQRKFMDIGLFYKMIDEISLKVPALRLSLRGESTLHPDFIKCVKYAKYKGIREVSFLTNGSNLTPDLFEKILLAGADWITVSIDGTGEQYKSIRKPLTFDYIYNAIKTMDAIKKSYHMVKPVIKIQSIWPAIRNNAEEFYNLFYPYVDEIAFNPLIDYLNNDSEYHIVYEDNFSCPMQYQRLVVASNGNALLCSNDEREEYIVGNANNETIYDIWHGNKMNKFRETHKKSDGFKNIDICRHCFYPRLMEDSESVVVNGREITVQNYINRPQGIGE